MARGYRMQDTLNQKGRGLPIIPRLSKETHQTVTYPQWIHDVTVKKSGALIKKKKKKKKQKEVKRAGRRARAQSSKGSRGGKKTKTKRKRSKTTYNDILS